MMKASKEETGRRQPHEDDNNGLNVVLIFMLVTGRTDGKLYKWHRTYYDLIVIIL